MNILTIAAVNVRRMLRDRSNIFFVFIFPLLIIVLLGLQYGEGSSTRLGLVLQSDGPFATGLARELEGPADVQVERYDDTYAVRDDVSRGRLQGAIIVPSDLDRQVLDGGQATVTYVSRPDPGARALSDVVNAVIAERAMLVTAARIAADDGGEDLGQAYDRAQAARAPVPGVDVEVSTSGRATFAEYEALGAFDLGASQQPLLFTFLTSLSGSAALIEARRLGITRRMLSTPTSARQVLVGLAAAALGGSMVPLEVMSPTLRQVAHATPHAWAMDAFGELVRRGGSIVDILDEAAALAAFAVAFLAVASWRLRRAIVG